MRKGEFFWGEGLHLTTKNDPIAQVRFSFTIHVIHLQSTLVSKVNTTSYDAITKGSTSTHVYD